MNDLVTLCLLGIFLIVGLMLLSRLMRGFGGPAGGTGGYGTERPEYDDPNIRSRGFFGRPRTTTRQYDDPSITSRGFFGRSRGGSASRGSSSSVPRSQSSGRVDNPNIRSRGGFGRDKK